MENYLELPDVSALPCMSDTDLRQLFHYMLDMRSELFWLAAHVWAECKKRKLALPGISRAMKCLFNRVASGQLRKHIADLHPEQAVYAYKLNLAAQDEVIAAGMKVRVIDVTDPKQTPRILSLDELTSIDWSILIDKDNGDLLPVEAQILALRKLNLSAAIKHPEPDTQNQIVTRLLEEVVRRAPELKRRIQPIINDFKK